MKLTLALFLVFSITGCSTRPPPPPTPSLEPAPKEELQAAERAVFACLRLRAVQYNDGVSEAATIARSIIPLCTSEVDHLFWTRQRGLPQTVERQQRQRLNAEVIDLALMAVLRVRNEVLTR